MRQIDGLDFNRRMFEFGLLRHRIDGGDDQPSTLTQLTSASSKMQFMATSSSTSLNSVGTSLETMARKS